MSPHPAFKAVYERPYVVIFAAAVGLSAHGLFTAAVRLGRIPAWLAWAYVLIVDLLAVAAYRTWRQASEAGCRHWAWAVAAAAAVGTVAMNTLAGYPELAASWVGPAISGFPPVAALLATALRMAERRLRPAAWDVEPDETEPPVRPATKLSTSTALGLLPAACRMPSASGLSAVASSVTSLSDSTVAAIVAAHVEAGGRVTDPELTTIVAGELEVSPRTARRRLQPLREAVAA